MIDDGMDGECWTGGGCPAGGGWGGPQQRENGNWENRHKNSIYLLMHIYIYIYLIMYDI